MHDGEPGNPRHMTEEERKDLDRLFELASANRETGWGQPTSEMNNFQAACTHVVMRMLGRMW